MIDVYRVPVPKVKLAAMPPNERVLFLQLAHISNEITTLLKLIIVCMSRPSEDAIARQLETSQALVLARLLMGKLKEAWELIRTSKVIAATYRERLGEQGQQAFDNLRRHFGSSNLMTVVRNGYAFHPPDQRRIEAGFDAMPESEPWVFYMSQERSNTFHLAADFVVGFAIANEIDPGRPKSGFTRLLDETVEVATAMDDLLGELIRIIFEHYFGADAPFEPATKISAPKMSDVMVPFYMQRPE